MTNSSHIQLELLKQFKVAREKNTYFILAAAASAIGFAMTQTKIEALSFWHIPLGISVLFWAFSFFCGLKFVEVSILSLGKNYDYLLLTRKVSREFSAIEAQAVQQELQNLAEKMSCGHEKDMNFYSAWQARLLLFGAVMYICWHIIKMYLYGV
jgi:hypothetical protein